MTEKKKPTTAPIKPKPAPKRIVTEGLDPRNKPPKGRKK